MEMVGFAFTDEELAFLADHKEFQNAFASMQTEEQLEVLCQVGEIALGKRNASA